MRDVLELSIKNILHSHERERERERERQRERERERKTVRESIFKLLMSFSKCLPWG